MLQKIKFVIYLVCAIAWGISAIKITEISGKIICTVCTLLWIVLMVVEIAKML